MDERADRVIDLGPRGGHEGGRVVAMGTPEDVARAEDCTTTTYVAARLSSHASKGQLAP